MPKNCLLPRFVRPLFIASFAVMLCVLSCNGNGGSHDGGGAVYTPGGGSGGSGSLDGSSGDSQNQFTAGDLLNLSNADNADRIIDLVSTETQETEETQTIVLKAADIGLPAGGTATLTISGGVTFSGTVQADADGNVSFVIPATPNGLTITVALSVANASGTVLYSGSSQETLSGDSLDIGLTLHRQYWTLPASISLTASPDGFAYDTTRLSETTTLSISGLEDAPAGAAITYAWELDSSPLSDSGPTLTRSWNELIGPTAPTGELTKTFTVTVSYTDIAGEAKTASASTDVIIGPPVTIPSFTIKVNPPTSYDTANSNTSQYALMNNSDPFTFEVELPTGTEFPAGTVLSWSITKVGSGGSTVTASGPSVSKTPAELGVTTTIGTWKVNCTASNSRAAAPVLAPEKVMQSKLLALPAITTIQTTAVAGCAPADNTTFSSVGTTDTYAFASSSSGSFTLTAVTSGTAVTGMTYNWSITGSTFSYEDTSSTCTVNLSYLSGFTNYKNSAGSWTVTCKLTYPGLTDSAPQTATLSAFLLVMPDFDISVSSSGLPLAPGAADTVFLVGTTDMSKTITFTATPKTGEPDFPDGTVFTWSRTTETSASVDVSVDSFITLADITSGTLRNPAMTCQASFTGISSSGLKGANFYLKPRIQLSAPTGVTVGSAYVNGGGGSVSPDASGDFNFGPGVDVNDVRVSINWTAPTGLPAGKNIQYYIYVDGNHISSSAYAPAPSPDTLLGGDDLGGWGSHTITVVTVYHYSNPDADEYENSVPSSPITVTIKNAP